MYKKSKTIFEFCKGENTGNRAYLAFFRRFSPSQILVMGFIAVILVGSFLLMLPISSNSKAWTGFLDSFFTATSSVCVTGLVVVDTSTHWSVFGKTVIIILIQIGGMGVMSLSTAVVLMFGGKIDLRQRILIKESLNQEEISGAVKLVINVIKFTVFTELCGAVLLSTVFIPEFGLVNGIGYSVFHSISGFCNAGFDLMGRYSGEYSSIISYYNNPIIVFTISALIILGGIGFPLMINVKYKRRFKKLNLSSKLAITTTIILLSTGTVLFIVGEYNNVNSIGNMGFFDKFQVAFFQSVTARTAGFGTVDFTKLRESTILLIIVLMFIGASPASTGGGIKTTTIAVLFIAIRAFLRNDSEISVFSKRINPYFLRKAAGTLVIGLFIVIVSTYVIALTQGSKFNVLASAFEVSSAFSTVGLSLAGSFNLNAFGKAVIIFLMFAGRVGSLTILTSFVVEKKAKRVRYPEDKVLVG